jgi:hypothetical protein
MSRNGSGTYTLPRPPFTPGTTISSADVNSDLSDIASALTGSVASDGQTSITGQLKFPSGTALAPAWTFSADLTTGFYLIGAGQIGWTAAGSQAATFNADKSVSWLGAQTYAGAITLNGTTYTWGAGAATAFVTSLQMNSAIEVTFDGLGNVISPNTKIDVEVPYNCTILRNTMLADQSGSIIIDVWKTAFSGYPPTSANKITASAPPTISSAQKSQDATLSGWTTTCTAGDTIRFNITSATTITRCTLSLLIKRTSL